MGNEIHRVIARHVLFLQEEGGVAFAFGENRDQNIGAGHFGAARRLHVDRRALNDSLEGGGWNRLGAIDVGDKVRQVFVNEFDQRSAEFVQIDAAGFHHAGCVGFVKQRQQQMLQRRKFVAPLIRQRKRRMNGLFQSARE